MSGWGVMGEHGDELAARLKNDPTFATIFRTVYSTIASGQVTATDWRDAVNLAFSDWHARNVSPILMRTPAQEGDDLFDGATRRARQDYQPPAQEGVRHQVAGHFLPCALPVDHVGPCDARGAQEGEPSCDCGHGAAAHLQKRWKCFGGGLGDDCPCESFSPRAAQEGDNDE